MDFFKARTHFDVGLLIVVALAIVETVVFALTYGSSWIRAAQKARHRFFGWLAVVVLFVLRLCFAPLYLSFVPLFMKNRLFAKVIEIFMYVVTGWFTLFLCMPTIMMIYCWWRHGLGDEKRPADPEKQKWPPVVVIVPVYREKTDVLLSAIDSMTSFDYAGDVELHLSFDDDQESDLYKAVMNHLGFDGKSYGIVNDTTVHVHRWPHSGKRGTQARTFGYINKIDRDPETIVILTDSDNFVYPTALHNLAVGFQEAPEKHGFAGYMTCRSNVRRNFSVWRLFQDTEYVTCEINRAFEVLLGDVVCLPGGFTALKLEALHKVADKYFDAELDHDTDDIDDYHCTVLGEDRFLSHLLQEEFPARSFGFNPSARCKTEPPSTFSKLVQQRRRWLLGAVSTDGRMITSWNHWKTFPMLCLFKTVQNAWRSTTVCQYLLLIGAIVGLVRSSISTLAWMIPAMAGPFAVAWIGATIIGLRLGRFKVPFVWPVFMLMWPGIQLCIDLYTIGTWRKRTWGVRG